jgi:hypothetical protein
MSMNRNTQRIRAGSEGEHANEEERSVQSLLGKAAARQNQFKSRVINVKYQTDEYVLRNPHF